MGINGSAIIGLVNNQLTVPPKSQHKFGVVLGKPHKCVMLKGHYAIETQIIWIDRSPHHLLILLPATWDCERLIIMKFSK